MAWVLLIFGCLVMAAGWIGICACGDEWYMLIPLRFWAVPFWMALLGIGMIFGGAYLAHAL